MFSFTIKKKIRFRVSFIEHPLLTKDIFSFNSVYNKTRIVTHEEVDGKLLPRYFYFRDVPSESLLDSLHDLTIEVIATKKLFSSDTYFIESFKEYKYQQEDYYFIKI